MKHLFRSFLINLIAIAAATKILPGIYYDGGFRTLLIGAVAFMLINLLVVPLLKVMFLPLNLLTLGVFAWAVNVVALYFLTAVVPQFKLIPYDFPGTNLGFIIIPPASLNTLWVAILGSFLIGFIAHLLHWLIRD